LAQKKDASGMGAHGAIKKMRGHLWVMRHFFIVRGAPRACVDFCDPTAVSMLKPSQGVECFKGSKLKFLVGNTVR